MTWKTETARETTWVKSPYGYQKERRMVAVVLVRYEMSILQKGVL